MDQGDRGNALAAHLCGEAQRGTVVVGPAVPDADDDAIAAGPSLSGFPRAASRSIESELSEACESSII